MLDFQVLQANGRKARNRDKQEVSFHFSGVFQISQDAKAWSFSIDLPLKT
jgi:hypothetical protein